MRLEVKENTTSNNYELIFSELPPNNLRKALRELGFTKLQFGGQIYTISKFPVYRPFIDSLEEVINKGNYWSEVSNFPIFESTHDSINKNLYWIVTIYYKENEELKEQHYIIFELYKNAILTLAREFGKKKYGDQYKDSEILPNKLKRLARKLLQSNSIIERLKLDNQSKLEATPISNDEVSSTSDLEIESVSDVKAAPIIEEEVQSKRNKEKERSFLQIEIAKIISELEEKQGTTRHVFASIIQEITADLKQANAYSLDHDIKSSLKKSTNKYKGWLKDSGEFERNYVLEILNRLLLLLDDTTRALEVKKGALSIKSCIYINKKVIQNVLIPIDAQEPFATGQLSSYEVDKLQMNFKHLLQIKEDHLSEVSSLDLFYLAQLEKPQSYGIAIKSKKIQQEWEKTGKQRFEQLGFPTDLKYPYVSLEKGFVKILPLETIIYKTDSDQYKWWFALIHTRPITEFEKVLRVIELAIEKLEKGIKKLTKLPNDPASKSGRSSNSIDNIERMITALRSSKLVIADYLKSKEQTTLKTTQTREEQTSISPRSTIRTEMHYKLQEVIDELISMEDDLIGQQEVIIAKTIHDLETVLEIADEDVFTDELGNSIESFKNWISDLEPSIRDRSARLFNRLIAHVGGRSIPILSEKSSLVIAKDIEQYNGMVENVLVPIHAKEPFQSGKVLIDQIKGLKKDFPHLYKIKTDELHDVSALELFQLSQLPHPTNYGMQVYRSDLLQEWEHRGADGFDALGFPTDMNYPYVNIHTGYRSVTTLANALENSFEPERDRLKWWAVIEHARPIASPSKGIVIIDHLISELVIERQKYINPQTKRPKTGSENKEAYRDLSFKIERLRLSRQVITGYLDTQAVAEAVPAVENAKEALPIPKEDYIDRVVATMHLAYREGKRLTKKKIEDLQDQTGAPSLGELWEAVELSWLLWYKMIYNEPISFEARLSKMITFWNTIQPTYAYSDSSKELYKQYSTPCPIGAILAQYTGMDHAASIFEPSAGNGLLLVGAAPKKTHVNEIDTSRKKSLAFQQFKKITTDNGAHPFASDMERSFDAVVTNPPFAKWEENSFDKERIVKKYFHNNRGLKQHLRLEHLMSGLALSTMKDHGRCGIIIMGHVYFDDQGFIAKYRPFFNWLYHYYHVDAILNMNSFKLYNKQGAVAKTMLILIGGRKAVGQGVAPKQRAAPDLDKIIDTFEELWSAVKTHIKPSIHTIIKQLKIAKRK
ncbi:N-6 DNA methylase [Kordia algicida OT-1]|uniref:Putative methylase/helicase n=1 Tax=Kordia algicida OT-1 TaxID=391587 RepID=A9DW49_9FLAO|nr:N-6 DNA methylase [Kordia algicida]EDP96510.1 putative methylase/helicase [Kordia algicida OT-1]